MEKQFEAEERHMIPSPKVATYDKEPKMSVQGVADKVAEVVRKAEHEFVMCNFAPPDMVRTVLRGSRSSADVSSLRLGTLVYMMPPLKPSHIPTRLSVLSTKLAKKLVTFYSSLPTTEMPSK